MQLQGTFLSTKVARRMLGAFILCALAPVALLSFIAYRSVTTQLEQQANDRLREDSKSVGMMLLGRVALLGSELQQDAALVAAGNSVIAGDVDGSAGSAPRFRAASEGSR